VEDCDCNFVGYAVNRSNCAPDCGCLDSEGKPAANPLSFC